MIRERHIFYQFAVLKRFAVNRLQILRKSHALQVIAARKSILPYTGNAFGNRDFFDGSTSP